MRPAVELAADCPAMTLRRRKLTWFFLGGAGIAAVILVSCATIQRTVVAPPEIEGATYVGNQTCHDCHTNYVRAFPFSPHARVRLPAAPTPAESGCEACHGPGSKHVQSGGGRGQFIVNPGKDPAACFNCHLQTHAEFNLPQHHPVVEGKMNCVQCHDPHGLDIMKPARGLAMARLNESCANCHREQSKAVIYEHEALREGCTVCHQPHGSINRKLLLQPDLNLCLKCHLQVQGAGVRSGDFVIGKVNHSAYLSRGACWSSGCHSAIHGSNISPRMFY